MQLLDVKNDIAKILYSPMEVQLYLSDFLLIEDINQSLISQIIEIESAHNDTSNIATVKLSLSINKSSNLSTYNGYTPSKESNIIYISPQEISQLIQSSKTNIYFGNLSSHPDVAINIGLSFLRDNAYILCDNVENVLTLNSNILLNLQHNRKRTLAIDFDGTYKKLDDVSVIKLGKDYKLPLNADAFEFMMKNDLYECSMENKAFIQGILLELESYANSLEEKFIPFSLFKKVIEEQAQFNSIPELLILRNKIFRYEQLGLFAESKEQFEILPESLEKNTITIVDATSTEEKFEQFIIQTVAKQIKKKCYFITTLNETNSSKQLISTIFENEKIRVIVSTTYSYKHLGILKSLCKNLILFSPSQPRIDNEGYSPFLLKLRHQEFILYGENTFYMPMILKLNAFDKSVFEKITDTEIKADIDKFLLHSHQESKIKSEIVAECENELNISSPVQSVIMQEMTNFPKTEKEEVEVGLVEEADLSELIPEEISDTKNEDEQTKTNADITEFGSEATEELTITSDEDDLIINIAETTETEAQTNTDNQITEDIDIDSNTTSDILEETEKENNIELISEPTVNNEMDFTDEKLENIIGEEPIIISDVKEVSEEENQTVSSDIEIIETPSEDTTLTFKDELKQVSDDVSDEIIDFKQENDDKIEAISEDIQRNDIKPIIEETESQETDSATDIDDITDEDLDFLDSCDSSAFENDIKNIEKNESSLYEKYIETENSEAIIECEKPVDEAPVIELTEEEQENNSNDTFSLDSLFENQATTSQNDSNNNSRIPLHAQKARHDLMEILHLEENKVSDTSIAGTLESNINTLDFSNDNQDTSTTEKVLINNDTATENAEINLEQNNNTDVILDDSNLKTNTVKIDENSLQYNEALICGNTNEANNTINIQIDETEVLEETNTNKVPDEFKDLTDDDIQILDNIDVTDTTLEEFKGKINPSDFIEEFIPEPTQEQEIIIKQEDLSQVEIEQPANMEDKPQKNTDTASTKVSEIINIEAILDASDKTPFDTKEELNDVTADSQINEQNDNTPETSGEATIISNEENEVETSPIETKATSEQEVSEETFIEELQTSKEENDTKEFEEQNTSEVIIQNTTETTQTVEEELPKPIEQEPDEEKRIPTPLERIIGTKQPETVTKRVEPQKEAEVKKEIPVYSIPEQSSQTKEVSYQVGDRVYHHKYGYGQVESFSHYSNKILFTTILFDDFGRRTLDAKLTGLEKV